MGETLDHAIAKGRITTWVIFGGVFIMGALGVVGGAEVIEMIKYLAPFVFGAEAVKGGLERIIK